MAISEYVIKFYGASSNECLMILELALCSIADVLYRDKEIPTNLTVNSNTNLTLNTHNTTKLLDHKEYIRKYGVDPKEIESWQWKRNI